MALRLITDKVMMTASKFYQQAVAHELRKTGLRYEDLLNEEENDIKEALSLADLDVKTGRTRRMKRALDLNLKQKNYMDYAKNVDQETFKTEFYETMLQIRARDQEFALLNQHKK
eukprot:CAMPEP_0119011414 /NCGR_PEP_ID=MMETSP1176-20130426/5666_1 /TAXON_ID=265551 /ORGANISM="Synedropsis recta cf, Strain CCMP1620" /LENGTH=114 /DNA_ID=CAMNT_0006964245 /DNA_START=38 /DNA_END=382 /DNA_ORIENTATION=+